MPSPLDALKKATSIGPNRSNDLLSSLTDSLIPDEWVERAQDAIDSPSLDRSPIEARIRGFGAGALEGVADQFNPLNLALGAAPMGSIMGKVPRLLKGGENVSEAIQGLSRAIPSEASEGLDDIIRMSRETPHSLPPTKALSEAGRNVPSNPAAQALEASRLEFETPSAKFLGRQEDGKGGFIELFNISGGPRSGSTVTSRTLRELGIPIPSIGQ